ncbi:MAG: hypothetical protein GXY82_10625 [Methanospirillum sp.]|nr:hypothetical protein [Methanospirillum sp.]
MIPPRDRGFTIPIWPLTSPLLLVDLAILVALCSPGICPGWPVLVSAGFGFVDYFYSDRLFLVSTGVRIPDPD